MSPSEFIVKPAGATNSNDPVPALIISMFDPTGKVTLAIRGTVIDTCPKLVNSTAVPLSDSCSVYVDPDCVDRGFV